MKIKKIGLVLPIALALSIGTAGAYEGAVLESDAEIQAGSLHALSGGTQRDAMIEALISAWEGEVALHVDLTSGRSWRAVMQARLQEADEYNLQSAMQATEFDQMLAALSGRIGDAGADPASIGDIDADLVYTPIVPCRIFDTRIAGAGNPIPATGTRVFDVTPWFGSLVGQGGADVDCGIPIRPAAVAVNLAAVSPASAGFLTAYPFGSDRPLAATVNHPAGGATSNEALIKVNPTGGWDMRVYSHRQSHVVGDVVGYYAPPEATTLDCTLVTINDVVIAAGGREFRNISCPAGYTAMGGGARVANNGGMRLEASNPQDFGAGWFASLANENAFDRTATFSARCCRIPGR